MSPLGRAVVLTCTFSLVLSMDLDSGQRTLRADPNRQPATPDTVSFAEDVSPIIQRHCLPCHAEDNYNPSEFSLDSYELIMQGGRHGQAVIPGDSKRSPLVAKLLPDPPFGDRMPLDMKKKRGGKATVAPLEEHEIQTIARWIDQGARNN